MGVLALSERAVLFAFQVPYSNLRNGSVGNLDFEAPVLIGLSIVQIRPVTVTASYYEKSNKTKR